ncbi:hypothetical protein [Metapseudomonas resinovorans]|uniref:Lipoprotein n=1 Tax=Metapseudomonas resinovorans NBRC 106553 TaxID=1245471 RepID=S6BQ59_METRE|nr:hypothetical protein [Pseudomonas resinovorans]BAN51164.1 hypothetical protein PCA10_54320 [Pseudomonas resinovorans NBRC 106553]
MPLPQSLRLLLPALLLPLLAACANIDAQTTEYVGVPHAAPTDPASVEVLRSEPLRPHDRLGEVIIDASTDPAPPVDQIEQRLREEAAKIGGEAVVVVFDRIQPMGAYVSGPLWARDVERIEGRKLKGIIIRYR